MNSSSETTRLSLRDGDETALRYLIEYGEGFERGFPSARLDRLAKMGMVEKLESSYRITTAGRLYIEGHGK